MNMPVRQESVLYAFNDLAVSKPTYDFINFVRIAEFHRIRYGYEKIYFVFVPGPREGFRADDLPPNDPEALRGMMRNIALPGCWLLPACAGVSYFSSREEAKAFFSNCGDNVFPRGYMPDAPLFDYTWMGINAAMIRGEKISPFSAPKEYLDQATEFIKLVAGDRKLITITLRESTYYPQRNSQISEWKKFIDYLDRSKYALVIIRDTSQAHAPALFDGVPECPLASISICFRAALYQKSYLTMQISNGPACVAYHVAVPTLTFGILAEGHAASSLDFFKRVMGQGFGDQLYGYPTCQKLVWEKDYFETIKTEFEGMTELIEQHADGNFPSHDFSSKTQLQDTCTNVVQYTALKMQKNSMDEDRDTLIEVARLTEGMDAGASNLLGVWYSNKGQHSKAEQAFRETIKADGSLKIAYTNLAASLQNRGALEDALPVYYHALEAFEATPDVIEAAFTCAITQGNIEAANRLVQKAEAMQMPPSAIQNLKSRIPEAN